MVSLPAPEQINRNLQVIDMMRRDGDLPQPGRIYQKGVENSKNYTSSNNQFIYSSGLTQPGLRQNATNYGDSIGSIANANSSQILNKRVGRFSNSPHTLNSELLKKQDEIMRGF